MVVIWNTRKQRTKIAAVSLATVQMSETFHSKVLPQVHNGSRSAAFSSKPQYRVQNRSRFAVANSRLIPCRICIIVGYNHRPSWHLQENFYKISSKGGFQLKIYCSTFVRE